MWMFVYGYGPVTLFSYRFLIQDGFLPIKPQGTPIKHKFQRQSSTQRTLQNWKLFSIKCKCSQTQFKYSYISGACRPKNWLVSSNKCRAHIQARILQSFPGAEEFELAQCNFPAFPFLQQPEKDCEWYQGNHKSSDDSESVSKIPHLILTFHFFSAFTINLVFHLLVAVLKNVITVFMVLLITSVFTIYI